MIEVDGEIICVCTLAEPCGCGTSDHYADDEHMPADPVKLTLSEGP